MITSALAVITSSSQAPVFAENWPNWRGPTRDGVRSETNLPVEWDTRKNVAWKLEMPDWTGSTPIVWEDRIFLNVAAGANLELWCVDRDTGQPYGSDSSVTATIASANRTCRRHPR